MEQPHEYRYSRIEEPPEYEYFRVEESYEYEYFRIEEPHIYRYPIVKKFDRDIRQTRFSNFNIYKQVLISLRPD